KDGSRTPGKAPVTRPVLSPANAKALRTMLEAVTTVDGATGLAAAVPGYRVAGKTGTGIRYVDGKQQPGEVGSFIGMAPADNPRFVVAVFVWSPGGGGGGGGDRPEAAVAAASPPAEAGGEAEHADDQQHAGQGLVPHRSRVPQAQVSAHRRSGWRNAGTAARPVPSPRRPLRAQQGQPRSLCVTPTRPRLTPRSPFALHPSAQHPA
ncbi:penicillin-binding transpeptidase domain-containing protein, partial [Micromonospora sp. DH15]|nr:penicillin-binding transpeptidase domain-containing protein [Micromonospora sp. DH15]